ncbi:hypothetical protein FOC1_g10009219 [Fusarium oxysporum f. sp. cubense race 1]|uniref:Uncharacterized protein n=1 Tax=Fusarium oxysporum f. sp. cubense (strain race 1) TaxID=1229664 RepID=N4TKX9_FUSC1|nr:hypothetical protein FOC1_g10009219 [Fusarium oxysporum f. sp. cubense race 1]
MGSRRRKKDTAAGSYSIIVSPKDEDGRRPLERYNGPKAKPPREKA